MKRFEELTEKQQQTAILFAKTTIKECIEDGIYMTNRPVTDKDVQELAVIAAEESFYNEDGTPIIGEEIPPYYLGGCV